MTIGSGLGASLGMAMETTYGTYATPTRWHEMDGQAFPFKKTPTFVQATGIATGSLVARKSRRVMTQEAAEGTFTTEVTNAQFGRLLNLVMGGTVTPAQQAATAAYLQSHPLVDVFGKMATFQVGIPQTDGTVKPHTFLGSKIKSVEFTCERGGLLMAAFEWDCRQFVEDQVLAAVSYTEGMTPYHFAQGTVKLGTVDSEAAVTGVRKMSLKIERPQNFERFHFGSAGLKAQPISNGPVKISGSLEVDYDVIGDFADRFHDNDDTSLVWLFTGANIDVGEDEFLQFQVPSAYFTGDTPQVTGHDVVNTTFTFEADDDETNSPLEILYQSTDITL